MNNKTLILVIFGSPKTRISEFNYCFDLWFSNAETFTISHLTVAFTKHRADHSTETNWTKRSRIILSPNKALINICVLIICVAELFNGRPGIADVSRI